MVWLRNIIPEMFLSVLGPLATERESHMGKHLMISHLYGKCSCGRNNIFIVEVNIKIKIIKTLKTVVEWETVEERD